MEAETDYEKSLFEMKMRLPENFWRICAYSCLYNCMTYSMHISVFGIEMLLLFCLIYFAILICDATLITEHESLLSK
jgi:hypothetical protein